jgi:hypothetical protein
VATQVPTANLQSIVCAAVQTNPNSGAGKPTGLATQASAAPRLCAHLVEFVALPGQAERLQSEIPLALQRANGRCEGFAGCVVMFSEQEARLVTLITLWREGTYTDKSAGNSTRLKKLLARYVDRWLRARSFHTFVALAE